MEIEQQRGRGLNMGIKILSFFHACANQQRKKNMIKSIFTKSNQLCVSVEEITEAFRVYFACIFTSTKLSDCDIERCTKAIESRVMDEMNG